MRTPLLYLLIGLSLLLSPGVVAKDVHVRSYARKDGTYVQPHYRSAPNHTTLDNWSTRGNVNPYTGAVGTRSSGGGGGAGVGIGGSSVIIGPRAASVAPPVAEGADTASTQASEQAAPTVITIEPQPQRQPRIITTNDLPRWTFGGERFDERGAVLSYQMQQASKGNPEALYAMGVRFLSGVDVDKNEALARDYLEQAKKKGNLRARAKLEELNHRKPTMAEANQ